jgi:hypothetical protein
LQSTKYFTFGFTVAPGFVVNLNQLLIGTRASGTGPRDMALRYSGDGFTANLATWTESGTGFINNTLSLSSLTNLSGTVEFRIVALSNTSANGTGSIASGGTYRIANFFSGTDTGSFRLTGTIVAANPTIMANPPAISDLTATQGNFGPSTNFVVNASNLSNNVTVTATDSNNFAISTDASSGFTDTLLLLTNSSGAVTNASVFVRLTGTSPGPVASTVSLSSLGATTTNVVLSGTVLRPELTSTRTNIAGLQAFQNSPSAGPPYQSYTLSGTTITNNVSITMPASLQASFANDGSGFANSLTIPTPVGAVFTTNIFVRISPSAGLGAFTNFVTNSTLGAASNTIVEVSGQVDAVGTPVINVDGTIPLPPFTTIRPNPSTNQQITVSGQNLPTNLTILPPPGWEISATISNNPTANNIVLATNPAGVVTSTPLFIRMASSLVATNYTNSVLRLVSGTNTNTVFLSGRVNDPPELNVSTSALTNFITQIPAPSASQPFTASGLNLTSNVTVTPPPGWQVSATNTNNFSSAAVVLATNASGELPTTELHVRLAGTNAAPTNYVGSLLTVVSGTNTNTVSLSGAVTLPPAFNVVSGMTNFVTVQGRPTTPAQFFQLSASNLLTNVLVTAPADYQVSANPNDDFTNVIAFSPDNQGLLSDKVVFVRLLGNVLGASVTNVAVTSGGSGTNVPVRGNVTVAPTPTVSLGTSITNVITATQGVPSAPVTFSVGGANLVSNVTVVAPQHYEISETIGSGYRTNILLQPNNFELLRTLFLRVADTAPVGENLIGVVNAHTFPFGSTNRINAAPIFFNGTVVTNTGPFIAVDPKALTAFEAVPEGVSASQSFTLGGTNLLNLLSVAAPAGYQVAATNASNAFSNTLKFTPAVPGALAQDAGWNYYTNGVRIQGVLTNNINRGSGFAPWRIIVTNAAGGGAGMFVNDPAAAGIGGMSEDSFGLFANPANASNSVIARRLFNTPLQINETFSFQWGNATNAGTNGNKGVTLIGSNNVPLATLNIAGPPGAITLRVTNGAASNLLTAAGTNAINVSFTRLTTNTVRLVIPAGRDGGVGATNFLSITSTPVGVEFYARALPSGPTDTDRNRAQPYFNNLLITTNGATTSANVATNVFVRLNGAGRSAGRVSGVVSLSSPGATNKFVSLEGEVYDAPLLLPDPSVISGLFAFQGTASDAKSFTLFSDGLNGTNNTISVGNGFEVSLSASNGFGTNISLPSTLAGVSSATNLVYVRIAAGAPLGAPSSTVQIRADGSAGQSVTNVVAVSGNVFAPGGGAQIGQPSPAQITNLRTTLGQASAPQAYVFSAVNLGAANVTATVGSNFQISTRTNGGWGSAVTNSPVGGSITNVTNYVRISANPPTGVTNNLTGAVTLSSAASGASNQTVALRGQVLAPPSVAVSPSSLTNLWTVQGFQSSPANFTLTGTNLQGPVTVTAASPLLVRVGNSGAYGSTAVVNNTASGTASAVVNVVIGANNASVGTYTNTSGITFTTAGAASSGLNLVNGDFSDLSGLTPNGAQWRNGLPVGWSTANSTNASSPAFSVFTGGGVSIANLQTLGRTAGGFNPFYQTIGSLSSSGPLTLTFQLFNDWQPANPISVGAAIYNWTTPGFTTALATATYTNTGLQSLQLSNVAAGVPLAIAFWSTSGAPGLDNLLISSSGSGPSLALPPMTTVHTVAPRPSITVNPTQLTNFYSVVSNASTPPVPFTVGGSNLLTNITLAISNTGAADKYEMSTNAASGWTNRITLVPNYSGGGGVGPPTIVAQDNAGNYSGGSGVSYVGSELGAAVQNWSDPNVPKTYNIGGSEVYGTAGYYQIRPTLESAPTQVNEPAAAGNNLGTNASPNPTLFSAPSFLSIRGEAGTFVNFNGYATYRGPNGSTLYRQGALSVSVAQGPGNSPAGNNASYFGAPLQFTLSRAASFRLGVAVDSVGSDAFAPNYVSLFSSATGTVFSGALVRDGTADMAFFDVSGNAGDTFTVGVWQNTGTQNVAAVSMVTFDELPGWTNGANGGTGFGSWSLVSGTVSSGSAGSFVGNPSSAGIGGMSASSFGLYANPTNTNNFAVASRQFAAPLAVGDSFSFQWGNNYDAGSSNGSKGANITDAGGSNIFTLNMAGTAAITLAQGTNPPITVQTNYGTNAMTFTFARTASNSFTVSAPTGRNLGAGFTNVFTVTNQAAGFAFFARGLQNDGNPTNRDYAQPYFNNLQIVRPGSAGGTGGLVTNTQVFVRLKATALVGDARQQIDATSGVYADPRTVTLGGYVFPVMDPGLSVDPGELSMQTTQTSASDPASFRVQGSQLGPQVLLELNNTGDFEFSVDAGASWVDGPDFVATTGGFIDRSISVRIKDTAALGLRSGVLKLTSGTDEAEVLLFGAVYVSGGTGTLLIDPAALSGFATIEGDPSPAKIFRVAGRDLSPATVLSATTQISQSAPPYEVSLDGVQYFQTRELPLSPDFGSSLLPTAIYVRLTRSAAPGPQVWQVNLAAGGATGNVQLNGEVTRRPVVAVDPRLLSKFKAAEGKPSLPQSFTVQGSFLMTNTITVTLPPGYEVSRSENTGFGSAPLTLVGTNTNSVPQTRLFLRLASGLPLGDHNGDLSFETLNRIVLMPVTGEVFPNALVPTFRPPVPDGDVRALASPSSGVLYVGGSFGRMGTNNARGLARLSAVTGDFEQALDTGGEVLALAYAPTNTSTNQAWLYAGGRFTNNGTVSLLRRFSVPGGVIDASFAPNLLSTNSQAAARVLALAVQSDGGVLAGGSFSGGLRRVLPAGSVDPDFAASANGQVNTLLLTNGGFLAGGTFTSVAPNASGLAVTRKYLARFHSSGLVDTAFPLAVGVIPSSIGFNGPVNSLAAAPEGRIYVGGNFSGYNGVVPSADAAYQNAAVLPADGSAVNYYGLFTGGDVSAVLARSSGELLAAGSFSMATNAVTAIGEIVGGLAQTAADGILDEDFNGGGTGAAGGSISVAIDLGNGLLALGGSFTSFNGDSNLQKLALLQAAQSEAYTAWATQWFGTSSAPEADPLAVNNPDGLENLVVFALSGGSPFTADASILPLVAQESGYLTLTANKNPAAASTVLYSVQFSEDLMAPWSSENPVPVTVITDTDSLIKARASDPAPSRGRQFLRLMIRLQ